MPAVPQAHREEEIGSMRRYELMLLFRPDLEDDKLQSAVERVTRAIVNAGGALTKVSPWGKRRLAYEIQHFREASYFLIHFDIPPAAVRDIERGLLITEEILRHLVTVIEDHGPVSEEEIEEAAPARRDDADEALTSEDDGADEDGGLDGAGVPAETDAADAVTTEADGEPDDAPAAEADEEES
jgi:small subunit ribosomal protein S6